MVAAVVYPLGVASVTADATTGSTSAADPSYFFGTRPKRRATCESVAAPGIVTMFAAATALSLTVASRAGAQLPSGWRTPPAKQGDLQRRRSPERPPSSDSKAGGATSPVSSVRSTRRPLQELAKGNGDATRPVKEAPITAWALRGVGSYGRGRRGDACLRGGVGRGTNVVAFGHAYRLSIDEGSYAELELRREDKFNER